MKKTLLAIVIFAAIFIFTSAGYQAPADSRIGHSAPGFVVSDKDATFELQGLRGRYVLVAFWSSTDAESRIANIRYDRVANNRNDLEYVAVNYDPSEAVFNEIVKNDSLNERKQYHDNGGTDSKIYKSYRLSDGFQSLLISPDGKIIAVNPDPEKIDEYVS